MSSTVLSLGDRPQDLPPLEASLALGSTVRLALEAGPLRLSLGVDRDVARALLGGGPPVTLTPGPSDDPVFLRDHGVLNLAETRLAPEGNGRFALESRGTSGWGASAVPWTLRAEARVDLVEVEHKSEKAARTRLAEVLPAPPTEEWDLDPYEVPELGLWRLEARRR